MMATANPQDGNRVSEDQKALLAKRRGQAAAQISDPDARTKFIASQGQAEAKGKGELPATSAQKLGEEAALKGYRHGTDRVPTTGPAMLHKNEAVLNTHDAEQYRQAKHNSVYDAAAHHMGGDEHQPKKELKEMRVRKGKSGGHIAEHHHTAPEHHPMEEHVLPNMDALHEHMEDHMGAPNPGEDEANGGIAELMNSGGPSAPAAPAPPAA